MKQSEINEIYNMTMTQREGFKKKYPTSESLANAIQEVFKSSMLAKVKKDLEKTKLEDVEVTGGFN
jgi:tRNA A37 threonylcarbamoyltransferase TsaD